MQAALLKQAGILATLAHSNLVRFLGVCLEPPMLVTETYKQGSLFKLLECARTALMLGADTDEVRISKCSAWPNTFLDLTYSHVNCFLLVLRSMWSTCPGSADCRCCTMWHPACSTCTRAAMFTAT